MVYQIKKLLQTNLLLKNTFIIFTGATAANIGNYLYYLFLGRFLGPADFGVFVSLISLLTLISIPGATIQIFSTKIAARYGEEKKEGLNYLIRSLFRSFLIISLFLFFILNLFSGYIVRFLNIDSRGLIFVLSFTFLFFLFIPLLRGVLSGLHRFFFLSLSTFLEIIFKLIIGVLLVIIGLKVYGAIISIVIASFLSIVILIYYLRFIFRSGSYRRFRIRGELVSLMPIFFSTLIFNMFYTVDIMLVKHYFPAVEAGYYGALSKIGLMIFFAGGALSGVLLSMASKNFSEKKESRTLLRQALVLGAILISFSLFLFYFFPSLVVKLLFGSSYLVIQEEVFLMGAVMSVLLLISILMNYFMALHRFNFLIFFVLGIALELTLIFLLHNSLRQVIIDLGISLGVVFLGMVGLWAKEIREYKLEMK